MEAGLPPINAPVLLFVEDDYNWAFIFREEFQKIAPHWKIIYASEGLAAMQHLSSAPAPQALVSDLKMSDMDGIELIEWVKDRPQFRSLPLIVFSNSEDLSRRQRCAALGVSSYLEKPGSLKELRNNIRYIVKLGEESRFPSQEWEGMSCV